MKGEFCPKASVEALDLQFDSLLDTLRIGQHGPPGAVPPGHTIGLERVHTITIGQNADIRAGTRTFGRGRGHNRAGKRAHLPEQPVDRREVEREWALARLQNGLLAGELAPLGLRVWAVAQQEVEVPGVEVPVRVGGACGHFTYVYIQRA